MLPLIALEWDSREIRLMAASGRGRQVVIEQAFAVPCEAEAAADDAPAQLGRRIAAEMRARGLASSEALVALRRNNIELRQMQVPPAADEDLPDLVRFQAMREFNELDDAWRLDYVPIEGTGDAPQSVLATAVAPGVLAQFEAVCQHAGLKMRRLLLRPCESVLLLRGDESIRRGHAALLVDVLGSEAELTAAVDGRPVFLHTARISGDQPPLQALLAAIRLTMAAAFNQLGGRRIESIALCGLPQADLQLARAIEDDLGLPVKVIDPFKSVKLGGALLRQPPEDAGRFAPLVAMLLAELRPASHAVDFLHPRRRAAAADPRKKWAVAGAAAAAILLGWLLYARIDQFVLAGRVDKLQQQSRDLDRQLEQTKRAHAAAAEVFRWSDEEVNWLDRIYALNQCFPPAKDAVLDELAVAAGVKGGEIDLKGWGASPEEIARLAESVRAHGYTLRQDKTGDSTAVQPYKCSFEAAVLPERSPEP